MAYWGGAYCGAADWGAPVGGAGFSLGAATDVTIVAQ